MHLTVRCPAKVNLFLAVGPKDRRNYHPLRTIFQAIDLCDTLTITESSSGRHEVIFDVPDIPPVNTVSRALSLLSEVVSIPKLSVRVQKVIPPESGLGGGSSNAAAVIRAVQHLAGVKIPDGELCGVAEAIGMDVPFFLIGGTAKGEGYGEKVAPLPDEPTRHIVVARPNVGCSTPRAYQILDEHPREWREFPQRAEVSNDFERTAPDESLALLEIIKSFQTEGATLCGSGSAVFGLFQEKQEAENARRALQETGAPYVWASRTLTRSESLRLD